MNARFCICMGVIASAPGVSAGAEIDAGSVKVESSIEGRVYQWRVTNVDAPPIVGFRVPVYSVYNQRLPEGWVLERSRTFFIARAEEPRHAIRRGRSKDFSVRATSSSAVFSKGAGFVDFVGGESLTVEGIAFPQAEANGTLLIPPLVISAMALACLWFAHRRRRRRSAEAGA